MKQIKHIVLLILVSSLAFIAAGQQINWKNLAPSQKHIIGLNFGFDNSSTIGVSYGYHLKSKMPIILNVEYSMPFGKKLFDDLKTKIGAQVNLVHSNNFYTTVKAYGVIRRFQNDLARLVNFGSEFTANAGIYKSKWFAGAEFGFDKAIVTHVKHSALMKEYNPGVKSGWYIPNGGYFLYGIQAGYSIHRSDLSVLLVEYSLAPENPCPKPVHEIRDVIRALQAAYPNNNLVLMGDSAGAALAVSVISLLNKESLPIPKGLIMISPWIDLQCNTASITANASIDPILNKEQLEFYTSLYLGDQSLSKVDPVSNMTGKFPPALILAGEREVLLDDSKLIFSKIHAQQPFTQLKIYPGQTHVWLLDDVHSPASVDAIGEMRNFLSAI